MSTPHVRPTEAPERGDLAAATKLSSQLAQLTMFGTLLRSSWLSSVTFRLSRNALGRAVSKSRLLGYLDGRNPGGDPFVERLQLPSRVFVANLTSAAQEELGGRARQAAGRVTDALRRAEADAATGHGVPWHLFVAFPVIGVFEYFVGVTVSESVYNLDPRSSHILAVAIALMSILAGAIWVVSMDEPTMRRHGRWVRITLPAVIAVFVGSSAIVLARGTSASGSGVVIGGSNTDQIESASAIDRLLTLTGHLVYPSAVLMAIITVILLEITLQQRYFDRRRPENSRTLRLEHKVRGVRSRGDAQLQQFVQASVALERAGAQICAAHLAGALQTLPPELLDRVDIGEPPVHVPAWRAEVAHVAEQMRAEGSGPRLPWIPGP